MNDALLFILTALSTYRLTRLFTADRILQAPRAWVVRRSRWLGYLVTCDWCLSIWLAPAPTALAILYPEERITWAILIALSASALVGLLSMIETRLDTEE